MEAFGKKSVFSKQEDALEKALLLLPIIPWSQPRQVVHNCVMFQGVSLLPLPPLQRALFGTQGRMWEERAFSGKHASHPHLQTWGKEHRRPPGFPVVCLPALRMAGILHVLELRLEFALQTSLSFAYLVCLQVKGGQLWNADFCLMEAGSTHCRNARVQREKWGLDWRGY